MTRHMKTKMLTPKDLANLFQVTDRTIARWCRDGKIKGAIKIGRLWRIPYDSDTVHRELLRQKRFTG